jgi:hypothetical protein
MIVKIDSFSDHADCHFHGVVDDPEARASQVEGGAAEDGAGGRVEEPVDAAEEVEQRRQQKVTSTGTRLGVNFTNILRAAFSYKSFMRSFFVLTF